MLKNIKNSNRMRRRTTVEKYLTLVSIFVFVLPTNQLAEGFKISPTFAINFSSNYPFIKFGTIDGANSYNQSVPAVSKPIALCHSPECITTASTVLSKMKTELDPCDDFYQFACGNYIDETQIPEVKVATDTHSVVSDKLQKQLKDIITEERPETAPKHLKFPNLLYKACMNTSLIESLGTKPIKQISDSLGGWPVIVGNSWDSNNTWTWQETVKQFRRLGFRTNYVVGFSIVLDMKNNTKRIIELDQSSTGVSREYLVKGLNETLVSAYYDYMVDVAVLFGADKEKAKRELRESLQFEMDLANISWPQDKRRNKSALYNLRTIKELQKSYPYVQWLDYINALLPEAVKIDENEVINLSVPSFFDDLGKLLQRTNKRVIANYMMWRVHVYSSFFLGEKFRERQSKFKTAFSGRHKRGDRWNECVQVALTSSSISVGSSYVRKHFKKDSKTIALEMVNNIREVFSQILDEVDWMDHKTKQEAQRKLHAMTTHIGYPDEMLDSDKLEEYYRKLEFDPDNYFASFLNMNVFGTDYSFNKLRLPVNKTEWITHARPAVVNAFYSLLENSIQFPAGILQGHFFSGQRPKYMNYGAIGYVIGHEITHGFDDQGRQFDDEGNLADWWQPDTETAFLKKVRSIIEQYGNFTNNQTGLKLNGFNTQGENIADNGGIKVSYLAYTKWLAQNGEEPRLPGLNYTNTQMFWISAAQNWCAKVRTEFLKNMITTGVHTPAEFRVLGPLKNNKDFSREFGCSEGTPMNPAQKNEVW